jgi:plastocyanin
VRSHSAVRAENLRGAPRLGALGVTIALGLVALAGCGSSSTSTSSSSSSSSSTPASTPAATTSATSSTPAPASSGQTLALEANKEGQFKFMPATLSATAGKATINFTNQASVEHNFTLASASGAVVGATPTFAGGSKTLAVTLTPGTYKFYCTVPGHRQAGMEGTLVVK